MVELIQLKSRGAIGSLVAVALLLLVTGCSEAQTSKNNERLILSVDANDSVIAFATSLGKGENGVVVYDLQRKNWFLLRSPGGYVGAPKLSTIDPRVLFVSQTGPDQQPQEKGGEYKVATRTLMKCRVDEKRCEPVFSLRQQISEPIEIPGEGLLFISGPPGIGRDGFAPNVTFITFSNNDFYLRRPDGEIERLTYFDYWSIVAVNLLDDRIIFGATGPGKIVPKDMLPAKPKRPGSSATSEIFEIKFNGSIASMKMDKSVFDPIVKVGTFWNAWPSAVKGSPILAFVHANRVKDRTFDLAVYNMTEKKLLDTVKAHSLQSMSQPSVTRSGQIIYYEYYDDAYHIMKYSIKDKKLEKLDRISVSDIADTKAEIIEITE